MQILFISTWYPSQIDSTNGDFVQRHAEAVSQVHNTCVYHVIFDPKADQNHKEVNERGRLREYILYLKEPKIRNPLLRKISKGWMLFRAYAKALSTVKKVFGIQPQCIHANVLYKIGIIALYYRFFKGIPYVVSEHWTAYLAARKDTVKGFSLFISRLAARYACFVMPVSKSLQQGMEAKGIRANYQIVSNIIETDLFRLSEGSPHTPFRFIHVSNGTELHKNIVGILKTAEFLLDRNLLFEFHIVSREHYKSLHPQIYFYHALPLEKVAELMRNSDALVHFSRFETFSLVLAESWACGKPVITSLCGGLSDEMTPEQGTVVPNENEMALMTGMREMLENYKKYDPKSLRQYVLDHFSATEVVKAFGIVYEQSVRK